MISLSIRNGDKRGSNRYMLKMCIHLSTFLKLATHSTLDSSSNTFPFPVNRGTGSSEVIGIQRNDTADFTSVALPSMTNLGVSLFHLYLFNR